MNYYAFLIFTLQLDIENFHWKPGSHHLVITNHEYKWLSLQHILHGNEMTKSVKIWKKLMRFRQPVTHRQQQQPIMRTKRFLLWAIFMAYICGHTVLSSIAKTEQESVHKDSNNRTMNDIPVSRKLTQSSSCYNASAPMSTHRVRMDFSTETVQDGKKSFPFLILQYAVLFVINAPGMKFSIKEVSIRGEIHSSKIIKKCRFWCKKWIK